MKKIHAIHHILATFLLTGILASCNKFVDVPLPNSQISGTVAFADDGKANSSMRGIYAVTQGAWDNNAPFQGGLTGYFGLASDELQCVSYDNEKQAFHDNTLTSRTGPVGRLWGLMYNMLYQVNSLMENVEKAPGVTAATKTQLLGEARFLRAFCFFYLVNAYGDVPLPLMSDYKTNALLKRVATDKVYEQIFTDLTAAQQTAGDQFSVAGNRVRANKWAATALLARAQLYRSNWVEAEKQASAVINSKVYEIDSLSNVFLSSSKEAILQFANPGTNTYTMEAWYVLGNAGNPVYRLTPWTLAAFEPGDKRIGSWTLKASNGDTATYKYKSVNTTAAAERLVVLRLGEQYLIRAEARAQQGKLTDAIKDLDVIRKRAGIPLVADVKPDISKEDLLKLIGKERTTELFAELGQRWFDVKRSGQADAIYSKRKPQWLSTSILLPVPAADIQRNPNLTQNEGYE
ncbi:RagB/SusD family nutrient uptake outer membrane protein [Chitinophaga arvensicola]|nr:RagB/SusD family nutrient uptake outer membrane protein [Chitinophaga arvensicola]